MSTDGQKLPKAHRRGAELVACFFAVPLLQRIATLVMPTFSRVRPRVKSRASKCFVRKSTYNYHERLCMHGQAESLAEV